MDVEFAYRSGEEDLQRQVILESTQRRRERKRKRESIPQDRYRRTLSTFASTSKESVRRILSKVESVR